MAKAKREKTRHAGVYKVGARYEWISRRSNTRGTAARCKTPTKRSYAPTRAAKS
jgi:hypothetical protein